MKILICAVLIAIAVFDCMAIWAILEEDGCTTNRES